MTNDEFFARPEISRAIDEVADRSFRQIEQEGGVGELPDGATFLDGLEVDPAEAGTITLVHTVHAENEKPARPVIPCNGGTLYCIPRCKIINGEQHCVWMCRCPTEA